MPRTLASIIVNWNNYERTRAFVASFSRAPQPEQEVIIIDNHSPNKATHRVQEEFPVYTYIYNDRNAGIAAANNMAMRAALAHGAKYLFLFNNDLEVTEPEFFERMVRYLDTHPKAAMAAPRLRHPDGRPQDSIKSIPTPLNQMAEWLRIGRSHPGLATAKQEGGVVPDQYFILASALLVRADAIEEIGFEDERFVLGYEDVDWSKRARQAGWEIHLVPDVSIVHYQGTSSKGTMANMDFYYGEKLRFLYKYHGDVTLALYRTVVALGSCARAIRSFILGVRDPSSMRRARSYGYLAYRIWLYPWTRAAYRIPYTLPQSV